MSWRVVIAYLKVELVQDFELTRIGYPSAELLIGSEIDLKVAKVLKFFARVDYGTVVAAELCIDFRYCIQIEQSPIN